MNIMKNRRSLSRASERINYNSLKRKGGAKHEQKLRNALGQGISAIELWKLMGDDSVVKLPIFSNDDIMNTADTATLSLMQKENNIQSPLSNN
jgi:hypothetical protein